MACSTIAQMRVAIVAMAATLEMAASANPASTWEECPLASILTMSFNGVGNVVGQRVYNSKNERRQ